MSRIGKTDPRYHCVSQILKESQATFIKQRIHCSHCILGKFQTAGATKRIIVMPNIMRAAHVFLVKVPASKLEDNPKILA